MRPLSYGSEFHSSAQIFDLALIEYSAINAYPEDRLAASSDCRSGESDFRRVFVVTQSQKHRLSQFAVGRPLLK